MAKLRIPHYFEAGTPALASEMNANFQAIENWSEAGLIGTDSIQDVLNSRTGGGPILTLSQTDTEYALAIQNGSGFGAGGGNKSAIFINQIAALAQDDDAVLYIRDQTSKTSGAGIFLELAEASTIPAIKAVHGSAETFNLKKNSVILLNTVFKMTEEYMKIPRQANDSRLTSLNPDEDAPVGSLVFNTTTKQLNEKKASANSETSGWAPVGAPVGSIVMWPNTDPPEGWLICNGNTVTNGPDTIQGVTADFSALYAVLNNNDWNGKLPDLRGAFVRGTGTNSFSPGSPAVPQTGPALGDWQDDATAMNGIAAQTSTAINTANTNPYNLSHNHSGLFRDAEGSTTFEDALSYNDGTDNDNSEFSTGNNNQSLDHRHTITSSDTETRPFSIGLNYIIKY